jgi:hypothetical protein
MDSQRPSSGLTRTEDHQYRWNDGPLVPGITTIISQKDRSGPLVGWARREAAAKAVREYTRVGEIIAEDGPEAAVDWIKREPERLRDAAAKRGTDVHRHLELLGLGRPLESLEITEEEKPFVDTFLRDFNPHVQRYVAVEFMVYSERHLYGGTADAIVTLDGENWLIDYKTSKGIYETTAMQLAAIRYADWSGRAGDGTAYRIPDIHRFGVVHVQAERTVLHEYDVKKADFDAFLSCRALYGWEKGRKPYIQRGPVVLGQEETR